MSAILQIRRVLRLAAVLLPCWAVVASAQDAAVLPPQSPFLRISAPFHTQVVNGVAQDAQGLVAATVSDDKTIRIWRADTGEALATLRVPIGEGNEGEVYAVAISPDGKTLLAGGHTGYEWDRSYSIYLFDLVGQRLKGRLPNLPAAINHIAFAPDGHAFAVALGSGSGVRLIDATNGRILSSDEDVFRDRVTWVAFDRAGRYAATTLDGEVRLYDPDGRRLARRVPVPGGHPYSLAFSPTDDVLAVGYSDQPRVQILSARDLGQRGSLVGAREAGGLGAVAYDRGGHLFAAGSVRGSDGRVVVRHWPDGAGGRPADWPAATDTVFQLDATPDGGVLVASADPALLRFDAQGRTVFRNASPGLDFRDLADRRFSVSQDGMTVTLQARGMPQPLTLDLAQRRIGATAYTRALTPIPSAPAVDGPRVTNWRNTASPQVSGRPVSLEPQELSRSFAAVPGSGLVVFGTDYALRVVSRDGRSVGPAVPVPAAAWAVAVSGDGRVVVAAVGDGTLRWFGLDSYGQLTPRAALFVTADGGRWAAWTPDGAFDHSDVGGTDLVGLQVNRGRGQPPDWFSFAQMYRLLYAPDTVTARLRGDMGVAGVDPAALVSELRHGTATGAAGPAEVDVLAVCYTAEGAERCTDLAPTSVARGLRARQPPSAPVQAAAQGQAPTDAELVLPPGTDSARLRYRVRNAGGTQGNVDVFVNGRNVMRGVTDPGSLGTKGTVLQSVTLDPGINQVQLRVYDQDRLAYAQSRVVQLSRPAVATDPAAKGDGDSGAAKPRLFVLVAGVDRYKPAINQLGFAVADARSVGAAIQAHTPSSYEKTAPIELFDADASQAKLTAALQQIGRESRPGDTVLIYLSGHGITIDRRYYFVTQNVASINDIPATAFSETRLVEALSNIQARNVMVFLDTCHAGAFSLDSASQIAHESGRYVLAASASLEEALDSYDNHNGVFATAILRGLDGGAAEGGRTTINNFQLGFFVTPLVRQLAAEKHHDQSARFKIAAEDAIPFPVVQVAPH